MSMNVSGSGDMLRASMPQGDVHARAAAGAPIMQDILREIDGGDIGRLRNMQAAVEELSASGTRSLPAPASEPTPAALSSTLDAVSGLNMTEVMKVLYESAKELREANREMRHAERDMAMAKSYAAADKIRSSALMSLCFSVVSSAVNIGMGAFSIGQGASQLKTLSSPINDVKMAKLDLDQTKLDVELGAAQHDFQTLMDAAGADPDGIDPDRLRMAEGLVQEKAAAAGRVNDERRTGLEKDLGSVEADIEKLSARRDQASAGEKGATFTDADAAELRSLEMKRDGINAGLDDCKARGERYADATSEANTRSGGEFRDRAEAAVDPQGGEKMLAYNQAESRLGRANSEAQIRASQMQGFSMVFGGVAESIKGTGDVFASAEQAEGQEMTAQAQEAQSKESELADFQKSFDELMASVQSTIKEAFQAMNEINATIYRNM